MKFILIATLTFCTLFSKANSTIPKCANTYLLSTNQTNSIELPAGTMVHIEMTELVESGKSTVGQIVTFRVRSNVEVNGNVVIHSGSLALGRVKSIEPTSFNHPEEIAIEVTAAQSVDGSMVNLLGQEQIFRGKFPNEDVKVQPGKPFMGFVANNTNIKI